MTVDDSTDDSQLITSYLAGEMSARERAAFEVRLAEEPRLADAHDRQLELELLATVALRDVEADTRTRASGRRLWLAPLLAAAALAIAALLWSRPSEAMRSARLVASRNVTSVTAYAASVGVDEGLTPAGHLPRGASNEPGTTVAVEDYLATVAAAERNLDQATSPQPAAAAHSGYATVRLIPQQDISALVLEVRPDGIQRLYPAPADTFVFGEARNRFAAGETHVLPRAVLVRNAIGSIHLHPGFDIGENGSVMLAYRTEPVSAALLQALDEVLAKGTERTVRDWLATNAFVIRELALNR